MSDNDVMIGVIKITDENREALIDIALEMSRRDCAICKRFEIPNIRCLKCARDVCEDCTGYEEDHKCQCKECYKP
jgi:hypothetical protein